MGGGREGDTALFLAAPVWTGGQEGNVPAAVLYPPGQASLGQ